MGKNTHIMNYGELQKQILMKEKASLENIIKQSFINGRTWPKQPSSDGFFRAAYRDPITNKRKQFAKHTLKELQDVMYDYFKSSSALAVPTFAVVFAEAYSIERLEAISDIEIRAKRTRTTKRIWNDYNKYIKGTSLDSTKVDEIAPADVEDLMEELVANNKLTAKAFSNIMTILNGVFKKAMSHRYITCSPSQLADLRDQRVKCQKPNATSDRIHTTDEVMQILNELHKMQNKPRRSYSAWALELSILTGLRSGELVALKKSDFDLTTDTFVVNKAMKSTLGCNIEDKYIIGATKSSRSNRRIPMHNAIKDWYTRYEAAYMPDELLFPVTANAVEQIYLDVTKRLGIFRPGMHMGPHSFRKYIGTIIVNEAKSAEYASSYLGNTRTVFEKNYQGLADLSESKDILNSLFVV